MPEGNMPEGNTPEGNTPEGNATEGNTPEGGTTDGSAGGDAVVPSGGIVGAWYGSNNFGEGVMIIDANQNLFSFAANGSGVYETVLGPVSGNLERFFHRDSVNVAFADSFSLVGDRPSATNSVFSDTADYNLTVQNDGQQIVHTGAGGDFIMTFATENDLAPISIDSIAGSWIAKSSFCPESCNITLEVTISATGAIFGSTQFNENPALTLAGDVSVAPGSSQHLNVLFSWGELVRVGAIHFDRRDPTRIIINTFGPDSGFAGSASFAASLIRR